MLEYSNVVIYLTRDLSRNIFSPSSMVCQDNVISCLRDWDCVVQIGSCSKNVILLIECQLWNGAGGNIIFQACTGRNSNKAQAICTNWGYLPAFVFHMPIAFGQWAWPKHTWMCRFEWSENTPPTWKSRPTKCGSLKRPLSLRCAFDMMLITGCTSPCSTYNCNM